MDDLIWKSEIDRGYAKAVAAKVAEDLGNSGMSRAVFYATWVSAEEKNDGRGGSPLDLAATALRDAILARCELPSD